MVRNRPGRLLNFSFIDPAASPGAAQPVVIPMADPTALVLGEYVYVTGTCDASALANFAIYRSRDLVHWEAHQMAFPEAWRYQCTSPTVNEDALYLRAGRCATPWINVGSGRVLSRLWAPQLFVDPALDPDKLYLTFTATPQCGSDWFTHGRPTVFVAECDLEQFQLRYDDPSKTALGYFGGVSHFYYTATAGSCVKLRDGGASVSKRIPVSGWSAAVVGTGSTPAGTCIAAPDGDDPGIGSPFCCENTEVFSQSPAYCQSAVASVYAPGHHPVTDPRTYMMLDSQVVVDLEMDPPERWALYNYDANVPIVGGFSSRGLAIAAHPLDPSSVCSGYGRMAVPAAGVDTAIVDIAHPVNTGDDSQWPSYPATAPSYFNGTGNHDGTGTMATAGVCEGASFFRRQAADGNYYAYMVYSRNSWASPAYGLFYRKLTGVAGQPISISAFSLAVASPPDVLDSPSDDVVEKTLLVSQQRTVSSVGPEVGQSFGHGEVFQFAGRYYLVCHYKEARRDTAPAYPFIGWSGRSVFFKELSFLANGDIVELSNDISDPETDVGLFIVSGSVWAPPEVACNPDFNNDGNVDQDDVQALLNVVSGGDCP